MEVKNLLVTIQSPRYKTLGSWLKDINSPAFPSSKVNTNNSNFDFQAYANKFLNYKDENEVTNLTKLKNYFTLRPDITRQILSEKDPLNLPLRPGMNFILPLEQINKTTLLTEGIEIVSNDEIAFKVQALIDLENDSKYSKVLKNNSKNIEYGDIKHYFPNITVWIWCRGLSSNSRGENTELQGQIFNITPFITNLQTSMSKTGGNFTIKLSPLLAEIDKESGQWIIKKNSFIESEDSLITVSDMHENKLVNGFDRIVRSQSFFHNIISTNDLVFIRFETLENEVKDRIRDESQFYIHKNELPNKIYDMIGLIDSNSKDSQFSMNEQEITITGRDLSKLFIEDGTYFYPQEFKQGNFFIQGGSSNRNTEASRVAGTGAFLFLGSYYNNTIEQILRFVIQQLSNIKVVPDDLFSGYALKPNYSTSLDEKGNVKNRQFNGFIPNEIQDKLNTKNLINTSDKRNTKYKNGFLNTNIKDNEVKKNIENRKRELSEKQNKIIDLVGEFILTQFDKDKSNQPFFNDYKNASYQEWKRFVRFLYENRYFNFNGNTNNIIGWNNYIYEGQKSLSINCFPQDFGAFRDDITNKKAFFSLSSDDFLIDYQKDTFNITQKIYEIVLEEDKLKKDNFLENPIELASGIWQIVKLVIDKKVSNRVLIDASMSTATGSLMNFLKKCAQEPFVEMFMDTYGDQYYIIVRKPPLDKNGMLSFLTGNLLSEVNNSLEKTKFLSDESDNAGENFGKNSIIDIEEVDVLNDNLSYDDSDVYSWYHFTPVNAMLQGNTLTTAYIPAIFFPEYAEIWGSKSLDLQHNYSNYYAQYEDSQTKDKKQPSQAFKQACYDMQFMIQSNAYLPFSRKGSITLNGDRRLKVGNPVRLKSTGEIFWIDSVSQSYSINTNSIDRVTTIQVSRGLVESFIWGVKGYQLNEYFKTNAKFKDNEIYSYWNIINTDLNFNATKKIDEKKTVKVRKKVENLSIKDSISSIQGEYEDGESNITNLRNDIPFAPFKEPLIEYEIKRLNKKCQNSFRNFCKDLSNLGWKVIITSGRRTREEQVILNRRDGRNAKPDLSKHVTGFAIDINLIATKNIGSIKKGTTLRKGSNKTEQFKFYKTWSISGVPEIAKKNGLVWGGNFNGYYDNVHFEFPYNSLEQSQTFEEQQFYEVEEEVLTGKQIDVFDETKIFTNFKVNKEVFNFFLRRQQSGYLNTENLLSVQGNVAVDLSNNEENRELLNKSKENRDEFVERVLKDKIKNVYPKNY